MASESRHQSVDARVAMLAGLNVLAGLGYAGLAVAGVAAGTSWLGAHDNDPWWPLASLFGLLPALVIACGVVAGLMAALAVLAAVGVVRQRTWGRVLTYGVAIFAILLGLLWAGGSEFAPLDLAIGGIQLLYGVLAIILAIATRGHARFDVNVCGIDAHTAGSASGRRNDRSSDQDR